MSQDDKAKVPLGITAARVKKEAVMCSGPTYIPIRSGKHSSSTASTHATDFDRLTELDDF